MQNSASNFVVICGRTVQLGGGLVDGKLVAIIETIVVVAGIDVAFVIVQVLIGLVEIALLLKHAVRLLVASHHAFVRVKRERIADVGRAVRILPVVRPLPVVNAGRLYIGNRLLLMMRLLLMLEDQSLGFLVFFCEIRGIFLFILIIIIINSQ